MADSNILTSRIHIMKTVRLTIVSLRELPLGLGPLLFLLYINDITNASNLGHFILFAIKQENFNQTGKFFSQQLQDVYTIKIKTLLNLIFIQLFVELQIS